jgi:hypothetical protein
MGRPRKNAIETSTLPKSDDMYAEQDAAAQTANKPAKSEAAISPIEVENWGKVRPENHELTSFIIDAPNDIEVRRGRMEIVTGVNIKDGYRGIVLPTYENAAMGLPTEMNYLLTHSDIIAMSVQGKVKLVLNINDETMIQEHTRHGSRYRSLVIPKGTTLAELIIL